MSFWGLVSGLFAVAEAIPKVKELIDMVVAAWVARSIASMKKENREAIRKAIDEHDQRDLEKAVGHPNPGEPSGDPGVVVRPTPPRMP